MLGNIVSPVVHDHSFSITIAGEAVPLRALVLGRIPENQGSKAHDWHKSRYRASVRRPFDCK
jgi:hypothetical protein